MIIYVGFNMDSSFHTQLTTISRLEENLTVKGNKLVCNKISVKEKCPVLSKLGAIHAFLEEHKQELNNSDSCQLQTLNRKLCAEATNDGEKEKIQKVFQQFIGIAEQGGTKKAPLESAPFMHEIVIPVTGPAVTEEEKLKNLLLVQEKFPRYQLGNGFIVYDTNGGVLPSDTGIDKLRAELKQLKQTATLSETKKAAAAVFSLIKLRTVVPISILIEKKVGRENGAGLITCKETIKNGLPLVLTKAYLHCFDKEDKTYAKQLDELAKDCDIYVPPNNSFFIILPKGKDPQAHGFNVDASMKWDNDRSLSEVQLDNNPPSISNSLSALLTEDSDEQGFYRMVSITGHGGYPNYPHNINEDGQGMILNLPVKELQEEFLPALADKNIAAAQFNSCYTGGFNSNLIETRDRQVPFPILIKGAQENVVYTNDQFVPILQSLEQSLFKKPSSNYANYILPPKQLTEREIAKWDMQNSHAQAQDQIITFIPATNKSETKTFYTPSFDDSVYIVDKEIRNLKNEPLANFLLQRSTKANETELYKSLEQINQVDDQVVTVSVPSSSYCFFENPIINAHLKFEQGYPIGLIARGSTSHHVINEITAPNIDIVKIADKTFNAHWNFFAKESSPEPATKVFAIGKITCRFQAEATILEQVVISKGPEGCFLSFRKREQFYKIPFKREEKKNEEGAPQWISDQPIEQTAEQAAATAYQAVVGSPPHKKTLKQLSKGRQTESDFYKALESSFWNKKLSSSDKLLHQVVALCTEEKDSAVLSDKLVQLIKKEDPNTRAIILQSLMEFIQLESSLTEKVKAALTPFAEEFLLHQAMNLENIEEFKKVLESNPALLNIIDLEGERPLDLALLKDCNKSTILLNHGAKCGPRAAPFRIGMFIYMRLNSKEQILEPLSKEAKLYIVDSLLAPYNSDPALQDFMREGAIDSINSFLQGKTKVPRSNGNLSAELVISALDKGEFEIAERLLSSPLLDPKQLLPNGSTLLEYLVESDHFELAVQLVSRKDYLGEGLTNNDTAILENLLVPRFKGKHKQLLATAFKLNPNLQWQAEWPLPPSNILLQVTSWIESKQIDMDALLLILNTFQNSVPKDKSILLLREAIYKLPLSFVKMTINSGNIDSFDHQRGMSLIDYAKDADRPDILKYLENLKAEKEMKKGFLNDFSVDLKELKDLKGYNQLAAEQLADIKSQLNKFLK
ncbi:MAG: hypothetical protein K0S74_1386 [Chlamydiales bacterium]|jgi:ankyrin repeat protein|nr:hypothetical protein [Chlamydiales bacterium]